MINEELPNHIVYSAPVIDFVTVTAETCLFLENAAEQSRDEFEDKLVKILPLLYLKAAMVQIPEPIFDDVPERFVTEEDYLYIKEQVEQLLGADDSYLDVFHPDMALSDTPIAAFVSEHLADIYQELKDFAANYQTVDTDIMNDALVYVLQSFGEHWGQKLLGALRALHAIRFGDDLASDEEKEINKSKLNRNSLFGFLQNEDDEEVNNLL